MRILLASASPRRRQLLADAGYDCDVHPVDVDERPIPGESAAAYVDRLARLKAGTAARGFPDRVILAADTTVAVDDDILGKPVDAAEAARMLARLSGRSHRVLTGVSVVGQRQVTEVITTTVWFVTLSPADIAWYVATGEPMDKAGGYAIQGRASRFIPRVEGSYSNVVGLPVTAVVAALAGAGVEPAPIATRGDREYPVERTAVDSAPPRSYPE
jgi:septum formation protein